MPKKQPEKTTPPKRRMTVIAVRAFPGARGRKIQIGERYECHITVGKGLVSSGKARKATDDDDRKRGRGPKETKPRNPGETKKGAEKPGGGSDEKTDPPGPPPVDPSFSRHLRRVCGSNGLKFKSANRREDGTLVVLVESGELVLEGKDDEETWTAFIRVANKARSGEVASGPDFGPLCDALSKTIVTGGMPAMVDLSALPAKEAAKFVEQLEDTDELERYMKQEMEAKERKTVADAIRKRISALKE